SAWNRRSAATNCSVISGSARSDALPTGYSTCRCAWRSRRGKRTLMPDSTQSGGYSVGVDIGGTFTDCVVRTPQGQAVTGKVPTTPTDRSIGFFGSIEEAAGRLGLTLPGLLRQTGRLNHATTT